MARLKPGRLVVRAHRLRTRAARQPRRRARCAAARTRRGGRRARAVRLDRDAAREARARPRPARDRDGAPPLRPARVPRIRLRARRACTGRRRTWARDAAAALERRAVETIPLPQFVGLYGDLLHATGHERAARLQYATEAAIRRLLEANGVRTDLETALFDVDHGIRLHASVALARKPRSALGRRSTATTCWRGRWRGTARCGEALALLEARPAARHAGRREALPPRGDRAAASATTRARGRVARPRSTPGSRSSGARR